MNDVVFIHGARQGSWVWRETIAALRASPSHSGKLLALDVPGCGVKSANKKPDFHVADIVQELADEILASDIKNALLVGHSQGGTLLPQLLAKTINCFSGVLFISAVIPLEGKTVAETMGSEVHGADKNAVGWPLPPKTTDQAELFKAMFYDPVMPDKTLQELLARAQIDSWPNPSVYADNIWGWDQLEAIDTAYLIARQDHTLPMLWQERFAKRIGTHTKKYYLKAGHQLMQTHPEAVANIIETCIGTFAQ